MSGSDLGCAATRQQKLRPEPALLRDVGGVVRGDLVPTLLGPTPCWVLTRRVIGTRKAYRRADLTQCHELEQRVDPHQVPGAYLALIVG
eukprot:2748076-Rhodomonas_salina.1